MKKRKILESPKTIIEKLADSFSGVLVGLGLRKNSYHELFEFLAKYEPSTLIPRDMIKIKGLAISDLQELAQHEYLFDLELISGGSKKYFFKLAPKGYETLDNLAINRWTFMVGIASVISLLVALISLFIALR